jgi:sterol 14-demethylase
MEYEIREHLRQTPHLQGNSGVVQIAPIMAQLTLFLASRCLQGKEVREQLDSSFAVLYHDLDDGFQPINFMLPWMPLPQNKRRDAANRKMTQIYADIIKARRARSGEPDSQDMLWTFMQSTYKDGTPMPDHEVAHMMIALLMAGQHSSSVTSAWIMLHLASQPEILEELYQEQLRAFQDFSQPITYDDLEKLPLIRDVIRETLRLHPTIHSILRMVKNPLRVEDTDWVIPPSHVMLAAPSALGFSDEYFPEAKKWNPHRWEQIANEDASSDQHKFDYGYGLVSTGAGSSYLPFGAGRHRCIAENYAFLQLTMVVTMMVREFKFRNLEGKEGVVVATDYSVCTYMYMYIYLYLFQTFWPRT